MKTELIETTEPQSEHDWSKPMLYVYEQIGTYVMGSGEHETSTFTGQCIIKGNSPNYVGYISETWEKKHFTPIRTPKTVKFDPQ